MYAYVFFLRIYAPVVTLPKVVIKIDLDSYLIFLPTVLASRSSAKLRSSRAALWCPILSVEAAGVAAAQGVVTVNGVTAATAPGEPSSESESSCALNRSREL